LKKTFLNAIDIARCNFLLWF